MGIIRFLIIISFLLPIRAVCAQNDATIYLDDVIKREKRQQDDEKGDLITRDDMDRTGAKDLWEALKYTPGVIISNGGARNEASFSIRGFGSNGVPVYVDGINATSPYNGRGDAARFLTGDLEGITVQKGYSSIMYGPSALGGAVFMRTAKPKKSFEGILKMDVEADSIFNYSSSSYLASLGTKQDKFYIKGTYQYRTRDHFRLSRDYDQEQNTNPQKKGDRLYSDESDMKATIIAGITPIDDLDIWAAYVYTEADKGVSPPEASPNFSLWKWPDWTRHTVSLNARYSGDALDLSVMAYYEKSGNTMKEYATVRHLDKDRPSNISVYDEYMTGFRVTAGYYINDSNSVSAAFNFRQDFHKDTSNGKESIRVRENVLSSGAEYDFKPVKSVTLQAGAGFDALLHDDYYGSDEEFAAWLGVPLYKVEIRDRWLLTAQGGIFWEFLDNQELRFTYARKNRFPTMNERYSMRFRKNLSNPNLKPEKADHLELGYRGIILNKINMSASVYYSFAADKIIQIEIPDPASPGSRINYPVNLDKTDMYGFELAANVYLNDYISFGGAFSYNRFKINKSEAGASTLTYYPEIITNWYAEISPFSILKIIPTVEYTDKRYIDGDGTRYLNGYFMAHIKVTVDIWDYFQIGAGVNNITDTNYELTDGFPMAGRSYFAYAQIKY